MSASSFQTSMHGMYIHPRPDPPGTTYHHVLVRRIRVHLGTKPDYKMTSQFAPVAGRSHPSRRPPTALVFAT